MFVLTSKGTSRDPSIAALSRPCLAYPDLNGPDSAIAANGLIKVKLQRICNGHFAMAAHISSSLIVTYFILLLV